MTTSQHPDMALFAGITNDHPDSVREAIAAGADVEANPPRGSGVTRQMWPLYYAAYHGHLGCLEVLIDAGARLNRRRINVDQTFSGTALNIAVRTGQIEIAERLLAAGADPRLTDKHNYNAAHLVMHGSHWFPGPGEANLGVAIDFIDKMLAAGAPVGQVSGDGKTILDIALERKQPADISRLVSHLLDRGAVPGSLTEVRHAREWTDAMLPCLDPLLDSGMDLNAQDSFGQTSLFKALGPVVVDAFAARHADFNKIDSIGQNAMQSMLSRVQEDSLMNPGVENMIFHTLMRMAAHGTDLEHRDYSGDSVLSMLEERRGEPIVDQLSTAVSASRAKNAMISVASAAARSRP